MAFRKRTALLNEMKELFQRYKSKIIGPYNPELKHFTKSLLRELHSTSPNNQDNPRIRILTELDIIFDEMEYSPIFRKDPENPYFTHYLLDFIKYFDFFRVGIRLTNELTSEFKKIMINFRSNPSIWETDPEKEDFICDLLFAIKMPEIVCSTCGNKIHNNDLKSKIIGIRKKITESNFPFSIEVPVYCCTCFKEPVRATNLNTDDASIPYNAAQNPRIRLSPAVESHNSVRIALLNELRQLFNRRRQNRKQENNISTPIRYNSLRGLSQLIIDLNRGNIRINSSNNNSEGGEPKSLMQELKQVFARRRNS